MALKGKDSSGWKDASAVYGKDASGWLYAKEAWAKNASGWQRAWTDCRLYDAAGGRGWSAPVTVVTYSGSCNNRTQTTTITRTKTGCPDDVRATTVASPDCNSTCFTSSAVNCDSCGSATLYTANAGSGCTTYTSGSCGSWNEAPNTDLTIDGVFYEWNSFFYLWRRYSICGIESGYYSITKCSVSDSYRVTFEFCSGI